MKIKQITEVEVEVNNYPIYTKGKYGMCKWITEDDIIEIYVTDNGMPLIVNWTSKIYSRSAELIKEYPMQATEEEWIALVDSYAQRCSDYMNKKKADLDKTFSENIDKFQSLLIKIN